MKVSPMFIEGDGHSPQGVTNRSSPISVFGNPKKEVQCGKNNLYKCNSVKALY